jgi:hypothetical protein
MENIELMNTKVPMRDFGQSEGPKFRTEQEFDEQFGAAYAEAVKTPGTSVKYVNSKGQRASMVVVADKWIFPNPEVQ